MYHTMELTKEENETLNIDSTYNNGAIIMIEGLKTRIKDDNVRLRGMYDKYLILKSNIEKDGLEFQQDYEKMYNVNNYRFFDIDNLKCAMREIKDETYRRQETLDIKIKQVGDSKWVV